MPCVSTRGILLPLVGTKGNKIGCGKRKVIEFSDGMYKPFDLSTWFDI